MANSDGGYERWRRAAREAYRQERIVRLWGVLLQDWKINGHRVADEAEKLLPS